MFWVINKDKVYSYVVTLSVIGVLFVMSAIIPKEKTVETNAEVNNMDIEKAENFFENNIKRLENGININNINYVKNEKNN